MLSHFGLWTCICFRPANKTWKAGKNRGKGKGKDSSKG